MRTIIRGVALVTLVTLVGVACGGSSDHGKSGSATTVPAEKVNYKALGLWDDGQCDSTKPPLELGLSTVFASPVLSLKDQATALEASAKAFNARGGANG